MFNKKFFEAIFLAAAFVSTMILSGNLTYGEATHKQSGKLTAPEHEYEHIDQPPACPMCKNVRVSPEKGRTHAKMTMVCPDCKNEISELAVHHCDQCGKDVLVCPMCKKSAEGLKAETTEAKCPECKTVRSRPVKGVAYAKWEMRCTDCKKDLKEWLVQHCDKCDKEFLACPICKKVQEGSE